MTQLSVRSGEVVALRLFDVAYAIDLKQAEALWAERVRRASMRGRLRATPPKAVAFGVPPVALALDPVTVAIAGREVQAEVGVRLYDFGVVVVALRLPVTSAPWAEFVDFVNAADRALGAAGDGALWTTQMAQVRSLLGEAFIRPTGNSLVEDYLLSIVHEFDEPMSADALQERIDLIPVLTGEKRELSAGAKRDLLRHRFSYYVDDLVVITWDRAFIHEPRGDTDVIDVLEVANAQLLEMRYYDELLDDELPRMYDLVEAARGTFSLISSRRYAALAGRLYTLVAEVTELTERVDNALQVTEDVYLARVYAAAMELFRVPTVSAAVDRKLAIIRETYRALHDEASGARAELLEVAILLLIAVEIVLSLVRH